MSSLSIAIEHSPTILPNSMAKSILWSGTSNYLGLKPSIVMTKKTQLAMGPYQSSTHTRNSHSLAESAVNTHVERGSLISSGIDKDRFVSTQRLKEHFDS